MKLLILILLTVMLTGCSTSAPIETVLDDYHPHNSHWKEDALSITYGIPEEIQANSHGKDGVSCVINDGEMIVTSDTLLASDLNTAVRLLSGKEVEELTIVKTQRFGLPEYRFAWCDSSTQDEVRLYTADLILDDIYGYAILCSTNEAAGNQYDLQIQNVFSTFGLYFDETK